MQGRPMAIKLQSVSVEIFTDRSQGLTPEQEERQLSVAVDELHY